MVFYTPSQLRAEFSHRLSIMYGTEVPAYTTLVAVSEEVNRDFLSKGGGDAERLGSIDRVTAERHGAIRVGSPTELAQVARIFAAFGMHPVGFYDLRDASAASVPVVSTAFRPITAPELAKNPFRVFTSMLTADDPRFFTPDQQQRLRKFLGSRTLFPSGLLDLADKAVEDEGLEDEEAEQLLELATAAFELSEQPVDHPWYRELEAVSAVAADIGGVSTTHINHLTPRVLDIDELYQRMGNRGITMIDEIQGPPAWNGPDILLRQTSFRALSEERTFRFDDGTIGPGSLRVRFGEVEQRGIALTPAGRELYDQMIAETDQRMSETGDTRMNVAQAVWQENLPGTESGMLEHGLGYFTFELAGNPGDVGETVHLRDLLADATVKATPIVYEDFLPRSAAGIFQSNLTGEGSKDTAQEGVDYSQEVLSTIIGKPIFDAYDLYQSQVDDSLTKLAETLNTTILTD